MYSSDNLAGINFAVADTVATDPRALGVDQAAFRPGQIAAGAFNSEWVYCLIGASGVTASSYVCIIDDDYTATMITSGNAALGLSIGVAFCASSEGQYAWMQTNGMARLQVGANCDANVPLYATDTPGVLDDDDTGVAVIGIVLAIANGGSQGSSDAVINWGVAGDLPSPPEGFAYIVNKVGAYLVNADEAYILAKVE